MHTELLWVSLFFCVEGFSHCLGSLHEFRENQALFIKDNTYICISSKISHLSNVLTTSVFLKATNDPIDPIQILITHMLFNLG